LIYTSANMGVFVFSPDGKLVNRFVGDDYTNIHDMEIRDEADGEFIYGARNAAGEGIKFKADTGAVVMKLKFPEESGLKLTKMSPTAITVAPNGDIFKAIRKGKADVVTDTIERFTADGIALASGEHLKADIVITATGLNVQFFGGAQVLRNGEPQDLSTSMAYKGLMLSGLPNVAFTFGYTNASWTLKADLTSEYVSRLLHFMDSKGYDTVVPRDPGDDVEQLPFVDLTSGYIKRALDKLPKSGSKTPWRLKQNYLVDLRVIRNSKIDDGTLEFSRNRALAEASSRG